MAQVRRVLRELVLEVVPQELLGHPLHVRSALNWRKFLSRVGWYFTRLGPNETSSLEYLIRG